LGAAARVGDPVILRMPRERVEIPYGDARWNGLLHEPLGFWNHGDWPNLDALNDPIPQFRATAKLGRFLEAASTA
jgi:hypothetical protein